MRAQGLGLILVIAAALAMGSSPATAAATSGGVKIILNCQTGTGTAGQGTFKVTANGSSSLVTVPCDGSATVTNPAWMPGATATIDQTAGPVGTKFVTSRSVLLRADAVALYTSALPCSPVTAAQGCPAPTIGLKARYTSFPLSVLIPVLLGFLASVILVAILFPIWVVGQRIRYFHRLYIDQPDAYKEAIRHMALMPGMAWQIRLRSKLLRVPLPPGFEDAQRVIREDKQRI